MAIPKITEQRYWKIRERQWHDAWGKNYVAAIWANPREAPSISRATILAPTKVGCRHFHTLSRPETAVALLALYHPDVWDVHEQRILFPEPRPHFLYGHPCAQGQHFPSLKGTVQVCERMGLLTRHQKCKVTLSNGQKVTAPFPFIGDFLTFLRDENGVYALNHNVKDKLEDFDRRIPKEGKPIERTPSVSAIERYAIEEAYYKDGEIDTRKVAGSEIDFELRCNLSDLFLSDSTSVGIPNQTLPAIWEHFNMEVGGSRKARVIIEEVGGKLGLDLQVIRDALKKGIWNRRVRVDLFRPINLDRPLRKERDDPVEVYRDWFVRG